MAKTLDYDVPRTMPDGVLVPDSLEDLQARGLGTPAPSDVDDGTADEVFEVPDVILDEELTVPVVPMQADEFRCERCFLVCHASRRAGPGICSDCA
ncbi:DUF4193 family protein [Allorhizocola rhizosphaerae]|uniref:DUF4193 family protein n=1 Tax=Allorhizocola rhizosphaerae TaxID=1872709 RepID=UPI000E3CFD80|nr:DUF4193 family protein [Allorhizocola rhizosphaerae]